MIVESLCKCIMNGDIKYNYYYRMIKSSALIQGLSDITEVQSYGIEVERQDVTDGNTINIERDCIKYISPQRYKVHNLLKLLYDNEVSPIHLIEVLGEYVDEYISDYDKISKEIASN